MALLIERAIEDSGEDILDRRQFSKNLAAQMSEYSGNQCLTIGLMGGWGTGKSSILNMVKNIISKEKADIVEFTPWYFSGREQLISDFFQVLSEKIQYKTTSAQAGELAKDLKKYSKILKPLALIPQFSIVANIISKGAEGISDFLKDYDENISLDTLKRDISVNLRDYPKKIIVFIDEIDRLNKNEINEIFQLVRALGDFENIIYLLAFDDKKVCEITEIEPIYLEKIINIPIIIPSIPKRKINEVLLSELNNILKVNKKEEEYWNDIYLSMFKNYFLNLREVYRFLNIIKFNQEYMLKEVNKIDFTVISFLQHFEPKAYEFIRKNGTHLCSCTGFASERIPTEFKKVVEESKNIQLNRIFDFEKLLHVLFSNKRILNNKQINSTRFFAGYFEYTLDENIYNYQQRMQLLEVREKDKFDEIIKSMGSTEFLENVLEICSELDEKQLILVFKCILEKIPSMSKKIKPDNDNQELCFKKLKVLLHGFQQQEVYYLDEIIELLQISDEIDLKFLIDYCVALKKHFEVNKKFEEFVNSLKIYISNNYSRDIYESFDNLSFLGIDIKQYVSIIIHNPDILFLFLEDISFLIDVRTEPQYDNFGDVIDVDEYKVTELCIDDIEKYTTQEDLLLAINKFPKEITRKHSGIINQVKNPRRLSEVKQEMERYGNDFQC